ncbi:LCP family protein [Salicibibacter kimchii]|uniref:LytR family transcriptional regulator n=1 Tax=Salicibibacter kimchii TaxID=2099786 RepID=A0A345BWI8_9BACI|nr:LCP family protein [Salicibibacter kimchii]AXF55319.1 LytR family transcriptional regulator [Salicibibacter kimchii]
MKKFLITVGVLLSLIILVIGGFALYLYFSVTSTADQMHSPLEREHSDLRVDATNLEEEEPVSFLLLGVDSEGETAGRTDTMIVLTVNPVDESMKMVSIPRDTRTEIVGRGTEDKINHAHAFGGAEMAIASVENFLDVPIDYVATINMDGFEEMVDAVGGVTVENDLEFEQGGHYFPEGQVELDGDEALSFVRMRYEDPQGDAGRTERQREVIEGLLREGAQFSSLTSVGAILDSVGSNVKVSADSGEMADLFGYESARHDIEQLELSGSGTRIDGIYYEMIDEGARAEVSSVMREHLELED